MRRGRRGFTLIELMIVVAIIGVLASLGIYGVRRYLLNARTAEARMAIGRMAKDAVSAFEREKINPALIPPGGTSPVINTFCASASSPVPDDIGKVRGTKYQSRNADWAADSGSEGVGFSCLKFAMNEPQYYRYSYFATGVGTSAQTFTAMAQGDLDGNGLTSLFRLSGEAMTGVVRVSPAIHEMNPEE